MRKAQPKDSLHIHLSFLSKSYYLVNALIKRMLNMPYKEILGYSADPTYPVKF